MPQRDLIMDSEQAKAFAYPLQAHALTISRDATREILSSVLLETHKDGFTLTSTDSHVCLHTFHECSHELTNGLDIPLSLRFWVGGDNRHNGLRDLGKSLVKMGPIQLRTNAISQTRPEYERVHVQIPFESESIALPLTATAGEDFPKYRTLFSRKEAEEAENRGLVLSPKIMTTLGKVATLADKAAGSNKGYFVAEPNEREGGPVRFHVPITKTTAWHGLAMPLKFDYLANAHLQTRPEEAPNA